MGFLGGMVSAAALSRAASGLTLALALASGASAQRNPSTGTDAFEEVRSAFAPPHTTAELRRRLGSLEASAIPHLFLVAATGNLPLPSGASSPLSVDERATLREALAVRPRRELGPFLEELGSRPQETHIRLEAQRLLAAIGTGDHLKLLVRLTTSQKEGTSVAPALRAGFRHALEEILARVPTAVTGLPMLLSESSPGLGSSIVEGLASVKSIEATRLLAVLLGRAPGLDALLLARLSERGHLDPGENRAVFDSVRRYLRQRNPEQVVAAVRAVGELGDDAAVESLVELMEHADERVKQSVFEALERISGLAFGADPSRWNRWYHEEMRWWDTEAEARLISIERGKGIDFARAVQEALEHRLFRDRIAESLALALGRDNVDEVRIACRALEQLRSRLAIPELAECLERDDARVRQAAHSALRAITGLDRPAERNSWIDALGRI